MRRGGRPRGWITRRWWLAGLPLEVRRRQIELFHGTDFGALYLPVAPSVMTLHDLSPWKTGERRAAAAGRIRRRAPYLVRSATMIVTHTEAVRREAIDCFNLPPSRVVAVPLAAGPRFRPRPEHEAAAVRDRLGVTGPYLLFVGTMERRKNVGSLVGAWRQARAVFRELNLVLVGRAGEDFRSAPVLNSPGNPNPIVAGQATDDEMAALLSGAALFVYPSLYEGFGLPVLEAMQAGAPVLISREASLMEVAGEAAAVADAESSDALARAIVELWGDPNRRRGLRDQGIRRASQFSWRQTAINTRAVYDEALRRF